METVIVRLKIPTLEVWLEFGPAGEAGGRWPADNSRPTALMPLVLILRAGGWGRWMAAGGEHGQTGLTRSKISFLGIINVLSRLLLFWDVFGASV